MRHCIGAKELLTSTFVRIILWSWALLHQAGHLKLQPWVWRSRLVWVNWIRGYWIRILYLLLLFHLYVRKRLFPFPSISALFFLIFSPCTSWVPWEKLRRATFIPDLIISFSISTDREAGPKKQRDKTFVSRDPFLTSLPPYQVKTIHFLSKILAHFS